MSFYILNLLRYSNNYCFFPGELGELGELGVVGTRYGGPEGGSDFGRFERREAPQRRREAPQDSFYTARSAAITF